MSEAGSRHLSSWGEVHERLRSEDEARRAYLDSIVKGDVEQKTKKPGICWANNCLSKGIRKTGLCDRHADRHQRGEDVTKPRPAALGNAHHGRRG